MQYLLSSITFPLYYKRTSCIVASTTVDSTLEMKVPNTKHENNESRIISSTYKK